MREVLTDKALTKAAGLVRDAMLSSLPTPESDAHDFSPAFQKQMLNLCNASRRRKKILQYTRRVAALFVAIILSAGLWLTLDVSARETFFEWVKEITEDSIVYRYYNLPDEADLPHYSVTWLPDGYYTGSEYRGTTMASIDITNEDTGEMIYFDYRVLVGASIDQVWASEAPEPVTINGHQGDYYDGTSTDESSLIIWIDESAGVVFGVNGFLEKEILLKMAESVVKLE